MGGWLDGGVDDLLKYPVSKQMTSETQGDLQPVSQSRLENHLNDVDMVFG